MKNINPSQEEQYVQEAILAARSVQEFLWSDSPGRYTDNGFPFDENNKEQWIQMFQKRVDKIGEIDITKPAAMVELRKRILQQAALSIKALIELERQEKEEEKQFSVLAEIEMAMAAGRERHVAFRVAHLTSEWYKKVIQEINDMTSIFDQAKISTSNSGNRELWFNTKFGAVLIEPQIDGRDGNMLSRYSRRGYTFPQYSAITYLSAEHAWYNLDKKELHQP